MSGRHERGAMSGVSGPDSVDVSGEDVRSSGITRGISSSHRTRCGVDSGDSDSDAVWFHIVLVAPEIPPNTGNVIRLAANTGCVLHLVEPLGFSMEDRLLRRAGLDYREYADVRRHAGWQEFMNACLPSASRRFAFTTRASRRFSDVSWKSGDWLVFGSETAGLPEHVRDSFPPEQRVRLPMRAGQRSLNLSNAVAVAVFEAWRQNGYSGGL